MLYGTVTEFCTAEEVNLLAVPLDQRLTEIASAQSCLLDLGS